ncbi:MOSC domain-containing protein [Nodosilinea sp. E11]|uniref:MOSC domain-containing protein n=1 Tax=Nodosilinea sp. E11 TaxID=3037479 RepID=UPI002934B27F|nr:MOSC domain-containing protein [Nodosilinea sp. E11]WOD40261.1 MOSC domain-containing protein [Nodosilinea sp. E11]
MTPQVATIQVGLPQTLGTDHASDPMEQTWTTGFFKTPVEGERWLSLTNLAGDGQADLKNHGGLDKAVLAYSGDHYNYWRSQLDRPDLPPGAFGENFTIVGQTEATVCVGDVYQIGEARVQVSQPRQPCWKLSRRWRVADLALQVKANGRTGWYFRVLQAGLVQPGLEVLLCDRPFPQWTIARANQIMHHDRDNPAAVALANCPLLSQNWQAKLLRQR